MLIVGSGNVVHNLRAHRLAASRTPAFDWAQRFDDAAGAMLTGAPAERRCGSRTTPTSRRAVPTPDHFIPLLYLAGLAAAQDTGADVLVDGYAYGSLSMTSYTLGLADLDDAGADAPTTRAHRMPDTLAHRRVPPTLPTSDPRLR